MYAHVSAGGYGLSQGSHRTRLPAFKAYTGVLERYNELCESGEKALEVIV